MAQKPKILAFSGSIRSHSVNTKTLVAAAGILRQEGADVTLVDLAHYPMPLFNGDDEASQGLPQQAIDLKAQMIAHDGFLIASPEYNGFFTPLLKNAIDWTSRRTGDEAPLAAYRAKTAAIIAASPGATGGMRGLPHLRTLLSNIGVHVVPSQFALKQANAAFDDKGVLTDQAAIDALTGLSSSLVTLTAKLAA